MSSAKVLLRCTDLTKEYRMGDITIQALRGVNLELSAGQFVVLLGPSGSGKSTLLNILGGLDAASSGDIYFQNTSFKGLSPEQLTVYRRNHVGFVFQFYNLIPNLSALENVDLVTDISEAPMAPDAALALVGLSDRKDFFPSQLSGGEQQRVAIARAIAKRPSILFCDEPTGALDLQTGKLVLKAIDQVHKELNTLIVIITHNSSIAGIADRVLHFSDGHIVKDEWNARKISIDEVIW